MKITFSKQDAKHMVDLISTRFGLTGKTADFCGFPVDDEDFVEILFIALSEDQFVAEDKIAEKYRELQRLR